MAKRYPRTIYLKIAFVIGAHLKEEKPVGKALWESLLKHAAAQRMNVADLEAIHFSEIKQTTDWWHKSYHNGTLSHKAKKQKLYQAFCEEATRYWRVCHLHVGHD